MLVSVDADGEEKKDRADTILEECWFGYSIDSKVAKRSSDTKYLRIVCDMCPRESGRTCSYRVATYRCVTGVATCFCACL